MKQYTTLAELNTLTKITGSSVVGAVDALNKSFKEEKISSQDFEKALSQLDNLIEKSGNGKYFKANTTPGECQYILIHKGNAAEIEKSINTAKLTKKTIQVTNKKTGKTYTTTRYVKTGTDESEDTGHSVKEIHDPQYEANDVKVLEAIIEREGPKSAKVRDLIALGIYDKKAILAMTGAANAQVYTEFKKLDIQGLDAKPTTGGTGEDMPAHDGGGFPPADMSDLSAKKVHKIMERQRAKRREESGINYKDFWTSYENTLEGVILDGYPKSLIAYGTGGLGKTFTLDQVKERLQVREYDEEIDPTPEQYDAVTIKGTTGLRDMWNIIVKNRDKLIVFDDADSMWGHGKEEQQNILKGMLDTSGDGTVRYGNAGKDENKQQIPKQIKFTGQVVFISNLERKDFPQPLISSRCGAIDLTMTKDETMDKLNDIKDLIQIKGKGQVPIDISPESRQAAYEFFVDHKDELDIGQINGRTYAQVAQIHNRFTRQGNTDGFNNAALIRMNLV